MLKLKQISLKRRYFKARLVPFRQPMFLLSIGMFSCLIVLIWQYGTHPEWIDGFLQEEESPAAGDNFNPEPTIIRETDANTLSTDLQPNINQIVVNKTTTNFTTNSVGSSSQKASDSQKLYEEIIQLPELFPPLLPEYKSSTTQAVSLSGGNVSGEGNNQQANSFYSPSLGIKEQKSLSNPLETAVNRVLSANDNPTTIKSQQFNPTSTTIPTQLPTYSIPTQTIPTQTIPTYSIPTYSIPTQTMPTVPEKTGETVPGATMENMQENQLATPLQ